MGVLSKAVTEYSRHYGNFKGVDFSNDHTQVHASRLAYLVNMYKDYKSGQGEALETMAGYRRRADFSQTITVNSSGIATATEVTEPNREIYGIFYFKSKLAKNLCGEIVNEPDLNGNTDITVYSKPVTVHIGETDYTVGVSYVIYTVKDDSGEVVERHAYLCETKGNFTGGKFRKAVVLRSFSDNLFFGCENGIVCSFNFDLRGEDGELPTTTYSYDNRIIVLP